MKKPYRLAYNWLEKWHTALMQTFNPDIDFWAAVSRDMSIIPASLTEADKKLYGGLIRANFTYLEYIFNETSAVPPPKERDS